MTRAANDNNQPISADPFARLPLFATDKEVAVAIVGKTRADAWLRATLPVLEARGFPPIDALHKGRPVPLIKMYYDGYLGTNAGFASTGAHGEEDLTVWTRSKRRG